VSYGAPPPRSHHLPCNKNRFADSQILSKSHPQPLPCPISRGGDQLSFQLVPVTKWVYQPCGINFLQLLFKKHFQNFAYQYEAKHVIVYGRFSIERPPPVLDPTSLRWQSFHFVCAEAVRHANYPRSRADRKCHFSLSIIRRWVVRAIVVIRFMFCAPLKQRFNHETKHCPCVSDSLNDRVTALSALL